MSLGMQIGIGVAVVAVMALAHFFLFAAIHKKFGCAIGRFSTKTKAALGGGVLAFLSVAIYLHFEAAKTILHKILY
ncbi:MAG: hypothetical protein OEV28_03865 [Nitrospirota bacterium]|nr:hypothetical protein [Nitrospirota bacterium]